MNVLLLKKIRRFVFMTNYEWPNGPLSTKFLDPPLIEANRKVSGILLSSSERERADYDDDTFLRDVKIQYIPLYFYTTIYIFQIKLFHGTNIFYVS